MSLHSLRPSMRPTLSQKLSAEDLSYCSVCLHSAVPPKSFFFKLHGNNKIFSYCPLRPAIGHNDSATKKHRWNNALISISKGVLKNHPVYACLVQLNVVLFWTLHYCDCLVLAKDLRLCLATLVLVALSNIHYNTHPCRFVL